MYNPATIDLARDVFARNSGNLCKTQKELKQKGHSICKQTLRRWRDRFDWEGYRKVYEEKLREYSEKVLDLDKKNLLELIEQKDEVREVMRSLDPKKQAQAYAQLNFSWLGYMKLIVTLRSKNAGNIEDIIDEIIGAFFQDPVTSKALANRKKEITKLVKKK